MRDRKNANRFPVPGSTKDYSLYGTALTQVESHCPSVHKSLIGLFTSTVILGVNQCIENQRFFDYPVFYLPTNALQICFKKILKFTLKLH
jgi:hypothetical protein